MSRSCSRSQRINSDAYRMSSGSPSASTRRRPSWGPPEPASSAPWSPTRSPPGPSPPSSISRSSATWSARAPAGRRARPGRPRRWSWPRLQGELVPGAGGQLDGLVADEELDGLDPAGPGADLQAVLGERHLDPVAAVMDAEADLLDLGRQDRVEAEHLPARPHAGQAAQHDVDRAGHGAQVDALGGGAAL